MHVLFEQGVRADENICFSREQTPLDLPFFLCGERPREQIHAVFGKISFRDRKVLAREHLGWREHGGLIPAFDGDEHGGQPYRRLSAAHVALEQSVHHLFALHVGEDLVHRALLSFGEPEGKARDKFQKFLICTGITVEPHLLVAPLDHLECGDEREIFLRRNPVGRLVFCGETFRIMHRVITFR